MYKQKGIKINILEKPIFRPENERILILRVMSSKCQYFIVLTWVNSQLARNHASSLTPHLKSLPRKKGIIRELNAMTTVTPGTKAIKK